jgi:damage-control phosphatase, subfamily I
MKSLQPIPQCVDCLMTLAKNLVTLAAFENPAFVEKTEHIAREILENAGKIESSSPQIANRILREIKQITGVEDPYADFKAQEMAQSRLIFSRVKNFVKGNLRSRLRLAALGNSLDFFKNSEQALAEIPDLFNNGFSFYLDHIDRLESILATRPQKLLYLTDNAGEIYFDLPLYEFLKEYVQKIYLVVKGGPALNDLTRVELKSEQLDGRFDLVADTGTDGAGIDWDNVSGEFLDLLASADLIVSKGMANFETLYPKDLSAPSFYLFKVKCEPIQNYIQAPVNSYLALWKEGNPSVTYRQ